MCRKIHHTRYKDPWRGRVRALEKNIIKFRAIQSVLAIYYTEKLKRDIISAVSGPLRIDVNPFRFVDPPRIGFKKAMKIWVDEGVITQEEATKIRRLTDYRNDLAHEFHKMNTDLSMLHNSPVMDDVKQYDYGVIHQLKTTINLLRERAGSFLQWGGIPIGLDLETIDFETTERVLMSELKTLEKKIDRLFNRRRIENDQLNREIKAIREKFSDRLYPSRSLRHENGRLSKTGVTLCEDMFNSGFSALAVAYIMEMSITSARSHLRAFLSRNNGRHS